MFRHLYQNPPAALAFASGQKVSDEELKEEFEEQWYGCDIGDLDDALG